MVGRVLRGVVKGLGLGVVLALLLTHGVGVVAVASPALAYGLAAVLGILVGVVAGRPVWLPGATVQAIVRGAFGATLAVAASYALRSWLDVPVDLTLVGDGPGTLATRPVALVPVLTTLLAVVFELDEAEAAEAPL